ncbi:hypothetical protein [Saccharothrix texasensis]|uniref:Uncharacterized protein n=1 Tax=Saccharothrix texasensis TaxID=103734 RepID=A0A3N1H8W1_9PSEU|nr:hypothetical protein [Saccharothrix texasensis]ROP38954.1 hypothetical protein EDD40_4321 [Saccharothrix texasensis]
MKHRVALAGVFAAVLVTSACGGGGSSASSTSGSTATTTTTTAADADPVKWTGTFCEGISPTIEGVLTLLKTMFEGGAEDPAVQKTALLDYSSKAGKSLSEAGEKLDDLGAPSPESQELHDELVKFFTDSGKTLTQVNTELAALDPADPEFATKLEQLGGDQADPSKLQEQIKKLQDDPKLGPAFKQAPECVAMSETLKSLGS